MLKTGIPVSVWDSEPMAVANTAARLLARWNDTTSPGREVLARG